MGGVDHVVFSLFKSRKSSRLKLAMVALALQLTAASAWATSGDPELISNYQTVRTSQGTPPIDGLNLSYGSKLAISNGRLAVGAADEYVTEAAEVAGAVYVYERSAGGQFQRAARLIEPTPGRYRRFGKSIGMDGDWLAVSGQAAVYLYQRSSDGSWGLSQTLTRTDGSIDGAIAMKGNFLVIGGDKTQQGSGSVVPAVHVYKFLRGSWVPRASITAPTGSDGFGGSVSVIKDRVLVGAANTGSSVGAAYVFEPDTDGNWQLAATLTSSLPARPYFGQSLSLDGNRCIVGAYGSAEIFERDAAGSWSRLATLTGSSTEADGFGQAVAIKAKRAIVGAPASSAMGPTGAVEASHGAAYVFRQSPAGAWLRVSRMGARDDETGPAKTGTAVAISGAQFVAGAPRGFSSATGQYKGRVVIFEEGTGGQDYGDAPAPYPTLKANNGARHGAGKLWLGSTTPDREADGQPDPDALGDDYDGMSDEDGIVFPEGDLVPGALNRVQVYVSGAAGVLDLWIDYNRDGDWDDEGEYVLKHRNVQVGRTNFRLSAIPDGYSVGRTFVRARLATVSNNKPTGAAADGEVEDMAVNIAAPVSAR